MMPKAGWQPLLYLATELIRLAPQSNQDQITAAVAVVEIEHVRPTLIPITQSGSVRMHDNTQLTLYFFRALVLL